MSSIYIEERWLKTRSLLSNPLIPVQGHSGWSLSQQIRVQGRTHLDRTPLHGRATHTHSHSLRLGQCRHTNLPHTHSFGTWEETVVSGEYHTDMGGGANSTGTVSPARIDFSLSDGWTKQCYWRATVVHIENVYSEMEAIRRGTSTRVEGRVTWTLKLALKTENVSRWCREHTNKFSSGIHWTWWLTVGWRRKEGAKKDVSEMSNVSISEASYTLCYERNAEG